jgi:hypothetical protein
MTEDLKKTTQNMVNDAVAWLLFQETKEGWQGDVRATSYALQALVACGMGSHEQSVQIGVDYLCTCQDPETSTWSQNDGDTAEALRTLVMCDKSSQDRIITDGLAGLTVLKASGKCIVRSEVGWVHPNLVARALIAIGQNPTELLKPISAFLTGEAGYDVKYTSRAVIVFKEAKLEDPSLKSAETFLRKSVNNIASMGGEYIGYLIQALVALGNTFEQGMMQKILNYLEKSQHKNGSWEDNVKATAQILIGLARLGFRYKKPSLLNRKNVARVTILSAMFILAVVLYFSLQSFVTTIVNVVELFIGIIIILEWAYPKIKLRV